MAIHELLAVVPPPVDPIDTGSQAQWEALLEELGTALPDDLRDIGHHYGSGAFAQGEIQVFNLFQKEYREIIASQCQILRETKDGLEPEEIPYAIFPESPGLFPCGRDNNGNKLTWLTSNNPGDWTIVVIDEGDGCEHWKYSLTTFLAKAFTNEITCSSWWPFEAEQRVFHRGRNQADVYSEISRLRGE